MVAKEEGDTSLREGARGGVLIEGRPQVGGLLEGLQSFFAQPIDIRMSHLSTGTISSLEFG